MPLLDALLAFALIIFVVSMAVTVIVQILVDSTQLRARRFKDMLTRYYGDVAIPFLRDKLGEAFDPSCTLQEFHWIVGHGGPPKGESKGQFPALSRDLVGVDAKTFKAHLTRSPLGKAIEDAAGGAGEKAEDILDQLTVRFEMVGHSATERFRRTTRSLAIVVGVFVAITANVDSIYLLDSLMGNPAATAALVDPKNPTLAELKKISERLTKLESIAITKVDLEKINEALAREILDNKTKGDLKQIDKKLRNLVFQLTLNESYRQKIDEAIAEKKTNKELASELNRINQELQKLDLPLVGLPTEEIQSIDRALTTIELGIERGFPVGWAHFPGEGCKPELDLRCKDRSVGALLTWIAGLLITAFLAGLGAPFWHDVITRVAMAMKVVKERGQA